MKHKLLLYLLTSLFSVQLSAQTVVAEGEFSGKNEPIFYYHFPKSNKVIVEFGKVPKMVMTNPVYDIVEYSPDGTANTILPDGEKVMQPEYSISGNTVKLWEPTTLRYPSKYYYYRDGQTSEVVKEENDLSSKNFLINFDDKYVFHFADDRRSDFNLEEGGRLLLQRTELFTGDTQTFELMNLDYKRMLNEDDKRDNEYHFLARICDKGVIEILSGSYPEDFGELNLYSTKYDFEGQFIEDVTFDINLNNKYFVNALGMEGTLNRDAENVAVPVYASDLWAGGSSNWQVGSNVVVQVPHRQKRELKTNVLLSWDASSKAYYFAGLWSSKPNSKNSREQPNGYCIIKFDKDGKEIWRRVEAVKDLNGFNRSSAEGSIFNLDISGDQIIFNLYSDYSTDRITYFHRYEFGKQDGGELSHKNYDFDVKMKVKFMPGKFHNFLFAFLGIDKYRNLKFNPDALVAIEESESIRKYLDSIDEKGKISVHTINTDSGRWLLESDNKDYYKILFFNN